MAVYIYFVLYMGEGKESKMMYTKEEVETITHIYYLFTELLVTKITRSALREKDIYLIITVNMKVNFDYV